MRNAITQRNCIMGFGSALQQPSRPHVSHAQSWCGGSKVRISGCCEFVMRTLKSFDSEVRE